LKNLSRGVGNPGKVMALSMLPFRAMRNPKVPAGTVHIVASSIKEMILKSNEQRIRQTVQAG